MIIIKRLFTYIFIFAAVAAVAAAVAAAADDKEEGHKKGEEKGEENKQSKDIDAAVFQLGISDLVNSIGSAIVRTAQEGGQKESIIEANDLPHLIKCISIAKEILITKRGHDATRLYAGAVLRHMHRMAGGWKAEEIEERLVIKKKPKGNKRVERIIVSVEGLDKETIEKFPIVFASGPEFFQVCFIFMAVMRGASLERDPKKLLDLLPLMLAWSTVAKQEIAFYAFVTFPFKYILPTVASLSPNKEQSDHLEALTKLQAEVHKQNPKLDKEEIEMQLDLDNAVEKSVFSVLKKKGIPLVNYHRHGSTFRDCLESKQTLIRVFAKGEKESSDLAQSLVYRSISILFNRNSSSSSSSSSEEKQEKKELQHFMSLEFWEDEELSTKTMEELVARINFYISASFQNLSKALGKDLTADAFIEEIADQFQTAEKEAKEISDDHKTRLEQSLKTFIEFTSSKKPESIAVELIEHKTNKYPWIKDLVFLYSDISSFCTNKPTYCKIILREMHKLRPTMKAALAVEELKLMFRIILTKVNVIEPEVLLKAVKSEAGILSSQLRVPQPPRNVFEEKRVKRKIEKEEEEEKEEKKKQKKEIKEVHDKEDEGEEEEEGKKHKKHKEGEEEEEDKKKGEGKGTRDINIKVHSVDEDLDRDDTGGNIEGTAFVWSTLDQFTVYAFLRISLMSLYYVLTHPSKEGRIPHHLLSRLSTDCYFLAKHPNIQNKIKKKGEDIHEHIQRIDKYYAGYLAACCNYLATTIYKRVMNESTIGAPVEIKKGEKGGKEEEGGEEEEGGGGGGKEEENEGLEDSLKAMNTWRNKLIVDELKEKGMNPLNIKEMQINFIQEAMNKALKYLDTIYTSLNSRCSNAKKLPTIKINEINAAVKEESFPEAPLNPLVSISNNVCYGFYLHEGLIRHLSGTAEDTTPYAIFHDVSSLPQNSVIEQNPLKYYPVCLRLMKTLTANDYGTWLEPAFAKVLSASQIVVAKAPQLEEKQSGFKRLKECVEKAQSDIIDEFSLIPEMLHFDMQAGVCDYLGLKRLKEKYDLVKKALQQSGKQPAMLAKVEEKEKIVAARLVAVSCLVDKKALKTIAKYLRKTIDAIDGKKADRAEIERDVRRVLAYEQAAKDCGATDELEMIKRLKEAESAEKDVQQGETTEEEEGEGEEEEGEEEEEEKGGKKEKNKKRAKNDEDEDDEA